MDLECLRGRNLGQNHSSLLGRFVGWSDLCRQIWWFGCRRWLRRGRRSADLGDGVERVMVWWLKTKRAKGVLVAVGRSGDCSGSTELKVSHQSGGVVAFRGLRRR
ncbi:hypothetical protein RND71_019946 [Anisodus tanguticus]|uniref:Uncharacterized protein n=1 Tax=Anisodus tanguticus TaxID=243964 RepID=A0AAE1S170_9SOLA|nr:hypothetical protein RND71_019946 [Anisodus tanguticus]